MTDVDEPDPNADLREPLLAPEHQEEEAQEACPPRAAAEAQAPLLNDGETAVVVSRTDSSSSSSSREPSSSADSNSAIINPWKNHNVILSLVFCVVAGTADSIWSSVVLSGFLLALAQAMGRTKEGNTLVGVAEGVWGLAQLLTALPVGYLADKKWGKAKTVRIGGALMLVTVAVHLWTLLNIERSAENSTVSASHWYFVLVGSLGLWGVVDGIAYGPSQALFADSIPTGRRSEMLTWLYTCYLMSSAIGPLVSIVLFTTTRHSGAEDWSLSELFPVFFVGVLLEIPAAVLMFFFSDKYVVPEALLEEAEEIEEADAETQQSLITQEATAEEAENDVNHRHEEEDEEEVQVGSDGADEGEPTPTTSVAAHANHSPMKAAIPYVLFASSLVTSLASGLTVKYFPLFFKELGFGSAAVQGIFLLVPVLISSFSFVAQKMGKRIGRIESTVTLSILGVSLLFFMTFLSRDVGSDFSKGGTGGASFALDASFSSSSSSMWSNEPLRALLIVAVYLVRTGVMNCSYPLLESILMDCVPSDQRSRWKALESIASFGWTGSALVGGFLSDEHSYQFTFSITATMQLCGSMLLLLIRPFVEAE